MKYEKTLKYDTDLINQKIMGPNPLKLEEELMKDNKIKKVQSMLQIYKKKKNISILIFIFCARYVII